MINLTVRSDLSRREETKREYYPFAHMAEGFFISRKNARREEGAYWTRKAGYS